MHLLSREAFKTAVFQRDGSKCVFCKKPGIDAHHIFDRKLFADGGYYLNNGATVCDKCHRLCEGTVIDLKAVWGACGIVEPLYPPGLDTGKQYDKWGNEVLELGRAFGPLKDDEGMLRAVKHAGLYWLFFR